MFSVQKGDKTEFDVGGVAQEVENLMGNHLFYVKLLWRLLQVGPLSNVEEEAVDFLSVVLPVVVPDLVVVFVVRVP